MADRLAALGGWLEVSSVPSRGTTIAACLPGAPRATHGTAGLR
jgi:signal transduction histidine kinase